MNKKEFIEKVREIVNPIFKEEVRDIFDDYRHYYYCVWWTVYPTSNPYKGFDTPLVGIRSQDKSNGGWNSFCARWQKESEKYERWFNEAIGEET